MEISESEEEEMSEEEKELSEDSEQIRLIRMENEGDISIGIMVNPLKVG